MTVSYDIKTTGSGRWRFCVGDLVGLAPSRIDVYDYGYDGYYYPTYAPPKEEAPSDKAGLIGIVIQIYEKYGYYSDRYYKIKWSDNGNYSNEKHENLILISHCVTTDKE